MDRFTGRDLPPDRRALGNSCQDGMSHGKDGNGIVHVQVRDPQTTRPSMELALYREGDKLCGPYPPTRLS
jgi:hypothetical protein